MIGHVQLYPQYITLVDVASDCGILPTRFDLAKKSSIDCSQLTTVPHAIKYPPKMTWNAILDATKQAALLKDEPNSVRLPHSKRCTCNGPCQIYWLK
ncbi:hypothetical protein T4C_4540 [Trichinella pseudospiralis]|uniref:Uncharacterized protein n=1 Tax=Trichinella pseudospiralis TaxID=6337 RepID=A0A0V1JRN4_TRIPS|nr:hypothetical protein T4C_4540 [Trichinella pseudospiralis]